MSNFRIGLYDTKNTNELINSKCKNDLLPDIDVILDGGYTSKSIRIHLKVLPKMIPKILGEKTMAVISDSRR